MDLFENTSPLVVKKDFAPNQNTSRISIVISAEMDEDEEHDFFLFLRSQLKLRGVSEKNIHKSDESFIEIDEASDESEGYSCLQFLLLKKFNSVEEAENYLNKEMKKSQIVFPEIFDYGFVDIDLILKDSEKRKKEEMDLALLRSDIIDELENKINEMCIEYAGNENAHSILRTMKARINF